MSSGDDLLERLLDWPYQGETMAHEAADRIRTLQAALMDWDALIEHQYSGSREAMSAMTEAAQRTARVLKGESSGDDLVERLRGIIVQVSAERDVVVALLREARDDLESYVTNEYPPDKHPYYERKWNRDMDLCRRIDTALASMTGDSHD